MARNLPHHPTYPRLTQALVDCEENNRSSGQHGPASHVAARVRHWHTHTRRAFAHPVFVDDGGRRRATGGRQVPAVRDARAQDRVGAEGPRIDCEPHTIGQGERDACAADATDVCDPDAVVDACCLPSRVCRPPAYMFCSVSIYSLFSLFVTPYADGRARRRTLIFFRISPLHHI